VRPICEAARRRNLRVVLDADKATVEDDPLFGIATHVVFSAECLAATTGRRDLAAGLAAIARHTAAFLAASDGPNDIVFLEGGAVRRVPVFQIRAVDTLGAGDARRFRAGAGGGAKRGGSVAVRRRRRRP
jgi:sulfofructose kinase